MVGPPAHWVTSVDLNFHICRMRIIINYFPLSSSRGGVNYGTLQKLKVEPSSEELLGMGRTRADQPCSETHTALTPDLVSTPVAQGVTLAAAYLSPGSSQLRAVCSQVDIR